MATTYHTPSNLRSLLPMPGTQPADLADDDAIRLVPAAVEPAHNAEKRRLKVDLADWKLVNQRNSRVALEATRKVIAARIDAAAGMLKKITSTGVCLTGDAQVLSGALSDIQLALLESKAGIQVVQKLPHVKRTGESSINPRSYALATSYLESTEYSFDESSFAEFAIGVQEAVSLEMF